MGILTKFIDTAKSKLHRAFMSAADSDAFYEMATQLQTELNARIGNGEKQISIKLKKPDHIDSKNWRSAGEQMVLEFRSRATDKVSVTIEEIQKSPAPQP